ncbi:hypothetical protein B0A49_00147 [Cryomyces minteri]|uniref:Uncharacterized protein n=1 Tax=Cryomyces minteri TaxID=331657 RepID=A0A4U0XVS8_9PEZI|nr:hypothetical protein B0A49_00147 [Cryomyces minteri]
MTAVTIDVGHFATRLFHVHLVLWNFNDSQALDFASSGVERIFLVISFVHLFTSTRAISPLPLFVRLPPHHIYTFVPWSARVVLDTTCFHCYAILSIKLLEVVAGRLDITFGFQVVLHRLSAMAPLEDRSPNLRRPSPAPRDTSYRKSRLSYTQLREENTPPVRIAMSPNKRPNALTRASSSHMNTPSPLTKPSMSTPHATSKLPRRAPTPNSATQSAGKGAGWVASAARRVGIGRATATKIDIEKRASSQPPGQLHTPENRAASPIQTSLGKPLPNEKPLPPKPVARISPFKASQTLLDASEKPLRHSPGTPEEMDWPTLVPEKTSAPRTVPEGVRQEAAKMPRSRPQSTAYPKIGKAAATKPTRIPLKQGVGTKKAGIASSEVVHSNDQSSGCSNAAVVEKSSDDVKVMKSTLTKLAHPTTSRTGSPSPASRTLRTVQSFSRPRPSRTDSLDNTVREHSTELASAGTKIGEALGHSRLLPSHVGEPSDLRSIYTQSPSPFRRVSPVVLSSSPEPVPQDWGMTAIEDTASLKTSTDVGGSNEDEEILSPHDAHEFLDGSLSSDQFSDMPNAIPESEYGTYRIKRISSNPLSRDMSPTLRIYSDAEHVILGQMEPDKKTNNRSVRGPAVLSPRCNPSNSTSIVESSARNSAAVDLHNNTTTFEPSGQSTITHQALNVPTQDENIVQEISATLSLLEGRTSPPELDVEQMARTFLFSSSQPLMKALPPIVNVCAQQTAVFQPESDRVIDRVYQDEQTEITMAASWQEDHQEHTEHCMADSQGSGGACSPEDVGETSSWQQQVTHKDLGHDSPSPWVRTAGHDIVSTSNLPCQQSLQESAPPVLPPRDIQQFDNPTRMTPYTSDQRIGLLGDPLFNTPSAWPDAEHRPDKGQSTPVNSTEVSERSRSTAVDICDAEKAKAPRSQSKGRLAHLRELFSTKREPKPTSRSRSKSPFRSAKSDRKAKVTSTGSPVPKVPALPSAYKPTAASLARAVTPSQPVRPFLSKREPRSEEESPDIVSPPQTEVATMRKMAMRIASQARYEADTPKKELLLSFAQVMADAVTNSCETERNMYEAQKAAQQAKFSYELTQLSIKEMGRILRSSNTMMDLIQPLQRFSSKSRLHREEKP